MDEPFTPEIVTQMDARLGLPTAIRPADVVEPAAPSAQGGRERGQLRTDTDMALLEVTDVTVRFGGNVALQQYFGLRGARHGHRADRSQRRRQDDAVQRRYRALPAVDWPGPARRRRTSRRCSPYRRARRGLSRTFQRLELFTSLSVRDNVRVAGQIHNANRISWPDRRQQAQRRGHRVWSAWPRWPTGRSPNYPPARPGGSSWPGR